MGNLKRYYYNQMKVSAEDLSHAASFFYTVKHDIHCISLYKCERQYSVTYYVMRYYNKVSNYIIDYITKAMAYPSIP